MLVLAGSQQQLDDVNSLRSTGVRELTNCSIVAIEQNRSLPRQERTRR